MRTALDDTRPRRGVIALIGITLAGVDAFSPDQPAHAGPDTAAATVTCDEGQFTITWQVTNDEGSGPWTDLAGTLSGGTTGSATFSAT